MHSLASEAALSTAPIVSYRPIDPVPVFQYPVARQLARCANASSARRCGERSASCHGETRLLTVIPGDDPESSRRNHSKIRWIRAFAGVRGANPYLIRGWGIHHNDKGIGGGNCNDWCDMRAYIIRRLLLIIPTLWILTIIVFLLVSFTV